MYSYMDFMNRVWLQPFRVIEDTIQTSWFVGMGLPRPYKPYNLNCINEPLTIIQ